MVDSILGGAIPIYFGSDDIFDFVDPQSVIYCRFSQDGLQKLSAFGRERASEVERSHGEILIKKAGELLKSDIQSCVERVRQVDSDSALYESMRRHAFLRNNTLKGSMFDLDVYADRIKRALKDAESYLFEAA